MRYGVISDIHGNLEALQAVLQECRSAKVQTLLCVGDVVGYGASPKECLTLIRQLKIRTVAGNHDWAVGGRLDFSHFTEDGKAAIEWTRTRMSMDDITYLNGLELLIQNKDCVLVHSSLYHPQEFIYVTDVNRATPCFALMEAPVCFIGHTHVPGTFVQANEKYYYLETSTIEIQAQFKYVVNVGSVGQPRDGNPMASYCIYDTQLQTIELRRVPYNILEAQRKIYGAGLPRSLGMRLAVGE